MAIAIRTAQTTREGPLASGTGTVRMGSGAAAELAVTWASRTERATRPGRGGGPRPPRLPAPRASRRPVRRAGQLPDGLKGMTT